MRIGVISDTHDNLREEVKEALRGCDVILHAGDICGRDVLNRLEAIAPVKAALGNNDWAFDGYLPLVLDFRLEGLRVCVAHRKRDLPKDLEKYDLAVYGHTHQYCCEWIEDRKGRRRTLLLNPGSCGPGRFYMEVTLAILETDGKEISVERIDLSRPPKPKTPPAETGDLREQIETVIRETRKGKTTDEIAKKHNMDPARTEQIARLYVTHPGVTAEGIMAKMGL